MANIESEPRGVRRRTPSTHVQAAAGNAVSGGDSVLVRDSARDAVSRLDGRPVAVSLHDGIVPRVLDGGSYSRSSLMNGERDTYPRARGLSLVIRGDSDQHMCGITGFDISNFAFDGIAHPF
jgi:hypothetical protein